MADRTSHWEGVYAARGAHEVSWYQARPDTSLRLIDQLGIGPGDAVIDVGGGASNLVDHLLGRGFADVTVLDITRLRPPGPYRLWHDRAVFHFLTDAADRRAYVAALSAAVPAGGWLIMATFAEDGPERCSNLPVCRYSPGQLAATLGSGFVLVDALRDTHVTPAQGEQKFIYACFRRA
jgi:hypothetical protein